MYTTGSGSVFEFSHFRLDCGRFELFRKSHPLRVERKPLELLILLASREGQLVTRAEIAQHLWSGEVFVDTDHGINTAIRKLRQVLRDDPDDPTFIQTVIGMGYRFIAPIREIEKTASAGEPPAAETSNAVANGSPLASAQLRQEFAALPAVPNTTVAPEPILLPWFHKPGRLALLAIPLMLAGLASLLWVRRAHREHTQQNQIRSLAILPLENLSGDAAQDYLADGMTGELITSLGQIGDLRVISQTTAMQYKHSQKPVSQIAQELHVDAILDGSVLRSGGQVRIATQLVDARADRQMWAQSYQGDLHQVLALQNQVAGAVAEQIRLKLTAKEQTRLNSAKPVNPLAYEAYLKGQFYFEVNALSAAQSALAYFQRAVELDPQFARAWVGIARAYNFVGEGGVPAGEAAAGADAAVAKALLLEPDLAEAYAERAWNLLYYHWDFPGAERDFRQALALDPKSEEAHRGHGDYYFIMGQFEKSLAEYERAGELSPASPLGLAGHCLALNFARRYDEAASMCSSALDLDPNYREALIVLQQVYEHQHNFELAEKTLVKIGVNDPETLAMFREIYGAPGVKGAFDRWFKRQTEQPDLYFLAVAYSGLGRKDLAFATLQKAFEQRTAPHRLTWVHLDPNFDALHSDPRFYALLRRFGLPLPPSDVPAPPSPARNLNHRQYSAD